MKGEKRVQKKLPVQENTGVNQLARVFVDEKFWETQGRNAASLHGLLHSQEHLWCKSCKKHANVNIKIHIHSRKVYIEEAKDRKIYKSSNLFLSPSLSLRNALQSSRQSRNVFCTNENYNRYDMRITRENIWMPINAHDDAFIEITALIVVPTLLQRPRLIPTSIITR